MNWANKEILITGGTGSLGRTLTNTFLAASHNWVPKGIRIFSRDELKQWEMKKEIDDRAPVSFLVGDIRDRKRVELATKGVDIIIHAAALKQVPACEDNPLEAIQTNVIGAQNVLYAALENDIKKVMAISTDKAVYPINLYGATKLCAEKLFIQGNVYSGGRSPLFSCCRYGNVLGSRGSVVPLFKEQYQKTGKVTVTDKRMTRFWITLPTVANFIIGAIDRMIGGELFIPKMPSAGIIDIINAVTPDAEVVDIGIRPGEKIHEILITKEEAETCAFNPEISGYIIHPDTPYKFHEYRSDTTAWQISPQKIKEMIDG